MKRILSKLGWTNSARSQVRGSSVQRRQQAVLTMENLEGRLVLTGGMGGLGGSGWGGRYIGRTHRDGHSRHRVTRS